jgi:hypothetical protein
MLHSLLHKKNLIGVFSDYHKCKVMLEGLIANNFVDRKNIEIKSFYENTILSGEYKEEESPESNIVEEFTDNNTTDTDNDKSAKKEVKKEISKELSKEELEKKIELQNSINELKKKRERMEENKRMYEVDIDLYNKFKKIKETNSNFNIPEMFIEKYDFFEELEKENKLCWENYYELYKPKNISTGYDKLFN